MNDKREVSKRVENLPQTYQHLPPEEQKEILKKLADQDVELRGELIRKRGQSEQALDDLAGTIDNVDRLGHEKKVYKVESKLQTGTGHVDVTIRGGDTRFILPVVAVIGLIVIGILAVMAFG